MLNKKWISLVAICLSTTLMTTNSWAHGGEHLAPGKSFPNLSLDDQHEKAQSLAATTKLVLFGRDMASGKLLEQALSQWDGKKLQQKGVVYIADISGMPGLIASLFAIPAMQDRPYPILLDHEGDKTEAINSKEDQVTLLFLDEFKITKIQYLDSAEQIQQQLQAL